jgi:hypothetical protein
MPHFSAIVPESHQHISPGLVETLMHAKREELFTGLMRLRSMDGENLLFTFVEGTQQQLYRCLQDTVHVIPRRSWFHALDHSEQSVGFLPLSIEGLRLTRLVHEAPVIEIEESTCSRQELTDHVSRWAAEPAPCIVQIQGEKIDNFDLIPGRATPIVEELCFGGGQARFSIADASFPHHLPQADYRVRRYISSGEHDVWREHELRLAFGPMLRMLLTRFGELAGRALTDRLCEQLSAWARAQGWKISVTSNGAVNRHYFDSLESAVAAYVDLLQRFREESGLAIGSRMVEGISRETLVKMDSDRRQLITRYIYTEYGAGSLAGSLRR